MGSDHAVGRHRIFRSTDILFVAGVSSIRNRARAQGSIQDEEERMSRLNWSKKMRAVMANDEPIRRDVLQALAAVPFMALLAQASEGRAQVGVSPVKVDTKGLVAKIKFEAPLEGFLKEINGKYKLRVTELTLDPGGYVGEHNHEGPGIRQVTAGHMTYVLPDKTVVYGPGDFFFESGDINHTVFNKTEVPMVHVLFEILPVNLSGPSLIPVRHH
jgi:quercetin dioxygenase-like cupin family protein